MLISQKYELPCTLPPSPFSSPRAIPSISGSTSASHGVPALLGNAAWLRAFCRQQTEPRGCSAFWECPHRGQ